MHDSKRRLLCTASRACLLLALLAPAGICAQPVEAPGQRPAQTLVLRLEDALARAPMANLSLLVSTEQVEAARQRARRTRADLLPSVSADLTQSRSQIAFVGNEPFLAGSGPPGGGAQQAGPSSIINNAFSGKLRARLAVLNPVDLAEYGVAERDVDIAELTLQTTVQDVLEGIARAWFNHVRNLGRLEVIETRIERDTLLLEAAQERFDAGVADALSRVRAEVALANTEFERIQQQTLVYETKVELLRILNYPLDTRLLVVEPPLPEALLGSFQADMLQGALEARSDYLAEQKTLERNTFAERAAYWERLPNLELSAEYGVIAETPMEDWGEEWAVAVSLSFPIFEGGRIRANVLEAQSAIRQQQYAVDDLEQQIEADLRVALRNVRSSFRQIAVAREQVRLREQELDFSRTRFDEGVADNRDLTDAQAALAEANDALLEARHQYHLSRLRLARVQGNVLRITRSS